MWSKASRTIASSLGCAALIASTSCAESTPRELNDARSAYKRAANGPAKTLNPAQLETAERSLTLAERTFADEGNSFKTRDRAYFAMRKAQTADVQARTLAAERERQKWQHQADLAQQEAYARTQAALSQAHGQLAAERAAREANERAAQRLANVASVEDKERGLVITLPGQVLFESGKSRVMPGARERLNRVAETLQEVDPKARVLVEGYTDSRGSDAYNMKLSQQRAESVRTHLVSQGLDSQRVQAEGLGEGQPIADNGSPEGRAHNRRVEIVIERGAEQGTKQQNTGADSESNQHGD